MAGVLFRDPEQVLVAVQKIESAIGRSAIDDDVLPVLVILCEHALNSFAQRDDSVERGRYD